MRGSHRSRAFGSALLAFTVYAASLGVATPARADGDQKAACIAASDEGQQLKIDGKLTLARKRLLACARAECPAIVRQDCAQWMAEVDAALPTVVLGARDAEGGDLIAVRVFEDGTLVADHLDGRALPLDPGPHLFRFETAGAPAVEVQVLARAGERNRPITASFVSTPRGAATPPSEITAPAPPTNLASGERPAPSPVTWVFAGVAVAALATALYFEVAQVNDYNHLSATCAGHCPADQVDHVGTERWVAGISAGIGVVSLGVAAYLVLARPAGTRSPTKPPPIQAAGQGSPIGLSLLPLPAGGIGTLSARF
jgi:hypothetical protein